MKIKYNNISEVVANVASEFNATIVLTHSEGDYQGVTMYLLKSAAGYGVIWYHYGSCSGCDAFWSYHENAHTPFGYDPKENQDEVWNPLEEGFRIELKNMNWLSPDMFRLNYGMEFSDNEKPFQDQCELYFRRLNGT